MNDKNQQIPLSLKVVALLFILGGITDVIEMFVAITQGNLKITLGFLGIFIGMGLLSLRPGWRTCALVFTWFAMIVIPIFAVIVMASPGPLNFSVLGQKVGHSPKELGLLVAIIMFLVSLWQYRVLIRHDVRKLFELETANQPIHGTA